MVPSISTAVCAQTRGSNREFEVSFRLALRKEAEVSRGEEKGGKRKRESR